MPKGGGSAALKLLWSGPGVEKQEIPESVFVQSPLEGETPDVKLDSGILFLSHHAETPSLDFSARAPDTSAVLPSFGEIPKHILSAAASCEAHGFIQVREAGLYEFRTRSGAAQTRLLLHGITLIDINAPDSPGAGRISLRPGLHAFSLLTSGKAGGAAALAATLEWLRADANTPPSAVSPADLFCERERLLAPVLRVSRTDPASPVGSPLPFKGSVSAELVALTPGSSICYTTDGTEPREESHEGVYSTPLKIDDSIVLKARTFKAGRRPSPVATMRLVRTDPLLKLVNAISAGRSDEVLLTFNQPLDQSSATDPERYEINDRSVGVRKATPEGDGSRVRLQLRKDLDAGIQYTLKANGLETETGNSLHESGETIQFRYFAKGEGLLLERFAGIPLPNGEYPGVEGFEVSELEEHPSYPNHPHGGLLLGDIIETPAMVRDHFGQRIRGFFIPPVSAEYILLVCGDDNVSLRHSSDDDEKNLKEVARSKGGPMGYTLQRQWNKYPTQQSKPVMLMGGKRYLLEALQKDNMQNDHMAILLAFAHEKIADGDEPLHSVDLAPYVCSPHIIRQPRGRILKAGEPLSLFFEMSGSAPRKYQWYRNGEALPNETGPVLHVKSATSRAAGDYMARVENMAGSVQTTPVRVTVIP